MTHTNPPTPKMIEAMRRIAAGDGVSPVMLGRLRRFNPPLAQRDKEGRWSLTEAGKRWLEIEDFVDAQPAALVAVAPPPAQSQPIRYALEQWWMRAWRPLRSPAGEPLVFENEGEAESQAAIFSVTMSAPVRVMPSATNTGTWVLYDFGQRYIQDASGAITPQSRIVPAATPDEPTGPLFGVQRRPNPKYTDLMVYPWQAASEQHFAMEGDAADAAHSLSTTETDAWDFRYAYDDTIDLRPAIYRVGGEHPDVGALDALALVGAEYLPGDSLLERKRQAVGGLLSEWTGGSASEILQIFIEALKRAQLPDLAERVGEVFNE